MSTQVQLTCVYQQLIVLFYYSSLEKRTMNKKDTPRDFSVKYTLYIYIYIYIYSLIF